MVGIVSLEVEQYSVSPQVRSPLCKKIKTDETGIVLRHIIGPSEVDLGDETPQTNRLRHVFGLEANSLHEDA
jgi:hypothetical protein